VHVCPHTYSEHTRKNKLTSNSAEMPREPAMAARAFTAAGQHTSVVDRYWNRNWTANCTLWFNGLRAGKPSEERVGDKWAQVGDKWGTSGDKWGQVGKHKGGSMRCDQNGSWHFL
jgi:hypothetical protein